MPLIYNGQEIGDPDTLNYFTDAKVKWQLVDRKMYNTIRSLIAVHHQQPALAAGAPVEFLTTNNNEVLAWHRGNVVAVVNFSDKPAEIVIPHSSGGKGICRLCQKTVITCFIKKGITVIEYSLGHAAL